MKKNIIIACISCIVSLNTLLSQETFKTMFYNILNFPTQSVPANRINHLQTILSDYEPDLFMVCELNDANGANSILSMMRANINSNYAMANFVTNSSDDDFGDQNDLQNLIYYDNTKFILESQNIVPTIFRDFNHYQLKLNTIDQDSNPIILHVIVCHLKSSNGQENQEFRFQMTEDLTAYLNSFPANSHVLLGGDLNVYTNSEDAFQELIDDNNNIVFIDPANRIGSWHNNDNYLDVFTQSTRTATGLGGATGGFDDRFDFILTSDSMDNSDMTNPDLHFVTDSYQVYGNNNNDNCYNREINSSDCDGADFNFSIRDALYNFSDHLPVTLEIATNQTLLSIPEFTHTNYYEFIGTNIIQNNLNLRINNQSQTTIKLNIFNSLGQLVKSLNVRNTNVISTDVSTLSSGIYYITVPNMNVEPLKFVKVN